MWSLVWFYTSRPGVIFPIILPLDDILPRKRAHALIWSLTKQRALTEGGTKTEAQRNIRSICVKFLINQMQELFFALIASILGWCIGEFLFFFHFGLETLNVTIMVSVQTAQEIFHPHAQTHTHTHISEQPALQFELFHTHFWLQEKSTELHLTGNNKI